MKASDVMTSPVISVTPRTLLKEVAAALLKHRVSAVPVVDGGKLVGIISEGDLIPLETLTDPRSQMIPVEAPHGPVPTRAEEVMSSPVVTVAPTADLGRVARLLLSRGIKRVPVVERGRLVGIISRRDLVAVLARSDASIKRQLERLLTRELSPVQCRVAVRGGVVHLDGVEDAESRKMAEILAATVPGVLRLEFD